MLGEPLAEILFDPLIGSLVALRATAGVGTRVLPLLHAGPLALHPAACATVTAELALSRVTVAALAELALAMAPWTGSHLAATPATAMRPLALPVAALSQVPLAT